MQTLFAGWDGGGTATGVACVDAAGNTLAESRFGPLNLNGSDEETIEKTVRDCLAWMRSTGACAGLCVGAAGVSNARADALLRMLLVRNGYHGPLRLAGDHEIALAGAVGGPGAVIVAGTGSVCYGRNARGETARCGGFGHLVDDGGSGYAIGRDILGAVLRAADGRVGPTMLTKAVASELGSAKPGDLVSYIYHQNRAKADIARLAMLLSPAVEAGDSAATAIADRAAGELCTLVSAVLTRLDMPDAELAFLGSILIKCAPVRLRALSLTEAAWPGARLIEPRRNAACGAALLARETKEDVNHA